MFWLGVDENIWAVYTQRPYALGTIVPDLSNPKDLAPPKSIWAANRAYFTWAGGNIAEFELMERALETGYGTSYEQNAKEGLGFLYLKEGFTEKAKAISPAHFYSPFPN